MYFKLIIVSHKAKKKQAVCNVHRFLFLLFSSHTFRGLVGAYMNPESFSSNFFVCIHFLSILIDFSQTCVSTSPCMLNLPVILFSEELKHLSVFERGYYTAG